MSIQTHDLETLRKAYCPPIDEGLFFAISSDYDIPKDNAELLRVLNDLKEAAIEQEDTEFDPSGTGGPSSYQDESKASKSTQEDGSTSNGVTSFTTGVSDLKWSEDEGIVKELENLSSKEKTNWLESLFPNISAYEIGLVLAKTQSLEQATDELLNLAFINTDPEAGSAAHSPFPKGIDGFAEEAIIHRPRKGRARRKLKTNESSRASSSGSFLPDTPPASSNVWSAVTDDVEFICSRTTLETKTVKSIYHANGAKLGPTIRDLAIKEGASRTESDGVDSIVQLQVAQFKDEFPSVPETQLHGLMTLARNIPSAVYELLEALTRSTEVQPSGKLHGLAQYAPIDLEKEDTPFETRSEDRWSVINHGSARELAAAHGMAASQAFSQASTAYKRGKSDRLMGGAAAYYASVGHERIKAAKDLQSALANTHVAAQSTATVLDLHGVSVADAVRIASYKTQIWWDGLGDAKYAPGGNRAAKADYKIVTGAGTHSKDHAPRIGPAVFKMLIREGWKAQADRGEITVSGRAKR